MKLRRTLPSVTEYSANKNNNYNNDSINIFDRQPFARSRQTQNQNNLIPILNNSQSPRKPIFQSRNSSQFRYSLSKNSQKNGKKTVTFVNQVNEDKHVNKQIQTDININRGQKIVEREYRRKSIFDKKNQPKKLSNNNNNNNNLKIVEAQINLKQFSDHLKMQHKVQAVNEQKIFNKISQLENKVNQLHNKAIIKNEIRFQQAQNIQKHEINSKNIAKFQHVKDNNVLKLQLQQVRRCQKIAKQNEVLYGALTKNLQQKTQAIQSRIRSTSFQHLQNHTNYDIYEKQNKSKQTKIVAFEDFEYFQLKNRGRDYEEIQGNMQLVSPFLLQQNKGKIKLF